MTQCRRCAGLMVPAPYSDSLDGEFQPDYAWRCTICEEIVDAVILRNRGTQDTRRGAFWRKKRVIGEME